MSGVVQAWACGGLCVLLLAFGAGRAYQRTRDSWTDYGAHRRATPAMRRRAFRVTGESVKILFLAAACLIVLAAIFITDK